MLYVSHYSSPIGELLIASKENKIVGLWVENQKHYLANFKEKMIVSDHLEVFLKTKEWLDHYFNGERPNVDDSLLNPVGSDFQKKVWKILLKIPYGEVTTYQKIAQEIAKESGSKHMSAQAVGNDVGHNPISILIPCHRVIGTNGDLTGYASGIQNKITLLKLEGSLKS